MCISFPKESLNLLLSRIRLIKIGYVVISKKEKQSFYGSDESYLDYCKITFEKRNRDLLLEEVLEKIKKLNFENLKEIKKKLERS